MDRPGEHWRCALRLVGMWFGNILEVQIIAEARFSLTAGCKKMTPLTRGDPSAECCPLQGIWSRVVELERLVALLLVGYDSRSAR